MIGCFQSVSSGWSSLAKRTHRWGLSVRTSSRVTALCGKDSNIPPTYFPAVRSAEEFFLGVTKPSDSGLQRRFFIEPTW